MSDNQNITILKIKTMNFFKSFILGIRSYAQAIRFLKTYNLTWVFIFPVIFNLIFGFWAGLFIQEMLVYINQLVMEMLQNYGFDFMKTESVSGILSFIFKLFSGLFFFTIYLLISGFIILILMSPIYAYLSEKTENILTGNSYPFDFKQFTENLMRGVLMALRNMAIEFIWLIALFFLSFIPLVGLFSALILAVVTAYFYGFSFMDYYNERQGFSINQSAAFVMNHKGLAISNGGIYALTLSIPLVGAALAGFSGIVSVVAATLAMHSIRQNEANSNITNFNRF